VSTNRLADVLADASGGSDSLLLPQNVCKINLQTFCLLSRISAKSVSS